VAYATLVHVFSFEEPPCRIAIKTIHFCMAQCPYPTSGASQEIENGDGRTREGIAGSARCSVGNPQNGEVSLAGLMNLEGIRIFV